MAEYSTDNVRILSVEAVKHPNGDKGDYLKIRIALLSSSSADESEILIETTRYIQRSKFDEPDAIRVARHHFFKICEMAVITMTPFAMLESEIAALTLVKKQPRQTSLP